MKSFDRAVAREKIEKLLAAELSEDEIYEWALGCAVSAHYDEIVNADPLLKQVLKDCLTIKKLDFQSVTGRRLFMYYARCLSGEIEFDTKVLSEELDKIAHADDRLLRRPRVSMAAETPDGRLMRLSRGYILIFALCSLLTQLYSLVNPAFLRTGEEIPTRGQIIFGTETVLLLVYAAALLFPPRKVYRGIVFYLFFPVLTFGMIYYWYITMTIITKFSLHIMFLLVFIPFGALPATLALIQVMLCREEFRQSEVQARRLARMKA